MRVCQVPKNANACARTIARRVLAPAGLGSLVAIFEFMGAPGHTVADTKDDVIAVSVVEFLRLYFSYI